MKIKIMEYNINRGFYNKEYTIHEKKRETNAIKVVKKENPDILIILEAAFFKGNGYAKEKFGIIQDYQKLFGYSFMNFGRYPKKKGGVVILSNMFLKSKNYCTPQRNHVKLWLKTRNKLLTIDVVHPSGHLNEEQKYQFIEKIFSQKNLICEKDYMLIGDLNALSPQDKYSKQKLLSGFKKFDKNYKKTVENFLKKKVVKYILNKGLVDSYKQLHKKFDFTVPTGLISKHKLTAMRIDYIFCSTNMKIKDAKIIKNKFSDKASGHYPIACTIEV